MSLALLCSGQGPQHADMFAVTGQAPEADALFAHAAGLLDGQDPRARVRSAGGLHNNRTGQVLCTVQALAMRTALGDAVGDDVIVAGYSVGEAAAWGVAGLVAPTAMLDLVARRAARMDAASKPGDGLLFVRGLSRAAIDDLCRRCDTAVAIVNPADAVVLGGTGAALEAAATEAGRAGAERVTRIGVAVASHTPRLAAAASAFRGDLAAAVEPGTRLPPGLRLFSGIDGAPVFDIAMGLDKLAAQIAQTVQWADCLAACAEAGATAFLELGPGRALAEMAADAHPTIPARSVEDFRSIEGIRPWARRAG